MKKTHYGILKTLQNLDLQDLNYTNSERNLLWARNFTTKSFKASMTLIVRLKFSMPLTLLYNRTFIFLWLNCKKNPSKMETSTYVRFSFSFSSCTYKWLSNTQWLNLWLIMMAPMQHSNCKYAQFSWYTWITWIALRIAGFFPLLI